MDARLRIESLILGIAILFMGLALLAARSAKAATSEDACSTLVRQASVLLSGDQIRVVSPDARVRTPGWFASLEGDSALQMRLAKSEPPVSIGFDRIGILEKKVGTTHYAGAGAMIGLAVGVAVGGALGSEAESSGGFYHPPRETVMAGGAIVGMIVGGIVGAFISSDRYEPVREVR